MSVAPERVGIGLPPLRDSIVIIIKPEESRPTVAFVSREGVESARVVHWVTTQPPLLELLVRALRLAGGVDDVLDGLSTAAGGEPGDDQAWQRATTTWLALPASERRRLMDSEEEA